jgi:hypothetical protein
MARPLDQIAISEAELAPFVTGSCAASKARALLLQQKGAWDLLRTGSDTLRTVRTRTFDFDHFQIKVQFNPGRLISTSAKVDAKSIQERKCFLCPANLPPAQRGILYNGEYCLLCNPFPIFPEHFTIPSLQHIPQRILGSFGAFLSLTRDLAARYTVLYNGPRCGASAPDHLHFQAGDRSFLPLDTEYDSLKARPLFESDSARAYSVENCLRHFISLESSNAAALLRAFAALHEALQQGGPEGEEPMMSILGFWQNSEWRVICFPRAKHRPSFYFKEGDEKIMFSPAAVEMGGICTTPREQDFEKVTREHLLEMFSEVCVSPETLASIKTRLVAKLAALV